MFLEKKEAFSCVIWDRRASVCAEFFCWPMEQFALYEKGGEQDMFDENEEWLDNFSVLLHRIIEETTETLFPDDRSGYFRNKNRDSSESYYTVHLDEF